ncbi:Hypothetical protein SMAX5B_001409 [Scophthalmus maximus]|uniref:Uncharacterized protein n=1 Tax=Scophthalmus maximus TaxID=52904 RepID=A0A2U9CRE0_SCOMX|nr:Hypothetical protein SMAX5B_001409 [Scophthalmus maximus]
MAGIAESSPSPIKIVAAVRIRRTKTVADVPAYWMMPERGIPQQRGNCWCNCIYIPERELLNRQRHEEVQLLYQQRHEEAQIQHQQLYEVTTYLLRFMQRARLE